MALGDLSGYSMSSPGPCERETRGTGVAETQGHWLPALRLKETRQIPRPRESQADNTTVDRDRVSMLL